MSYSRRPEAVAIVRDFLIQVARAPAETALPTYGDVAATYGGVARGVAPILNSISRECLTAKQPDLSALVVDKASGLASSFQGRPVEPGTASELRWRAELGSIRRHSWES